MKQGFVLSVRYNMYEDRAHGDHSMYTGMQAIESLTERTPSTHSKLFRLHKYTF